jgi:diguanylate cyclase (GGDEF)-like protein/PAS domain S-box-containing protein
MHHLSTIIQGLVKNLKEILFMRIVIELKKPEHNIPPSSLDARKDTHTLFPSTTEPVEHQSSAAVEITLLQSQLQTEIAERQRLEALLLSQINTEEESQTEQKRYQRQDAISQLGQRSILNRNLDHLFDEVVTLVAQTLEVDLCCLWELLPNRSAFMLGASYGSDQDLGTVTIEATSRSYTGYTLQINENLVMATYQPVLTQDLRVETRFRGDPFLQNHQVVSGLTVIVPTPLGPFGVLGIYSKDEYKFTGEEISFLTIVSHILSAAIDRHNYESRLTLLERAINASQNGIIITDALESTNPVIYVNKGFETITGYSQSEILGQNCNFLQKDDRYQTEIEAIRDALSSGQECQVTLRNYRKDGSLFWNQLYIAPVQDEQGHLTNFIGIQADVSDIKQVEENLATSEAKFRGIFEQAGVGIVQLDRFGNFLTVNPGFSKILGYTTEQVRTKVFTDLYRINIQFSPTLEQNQAITEFQSFLTNAQTGRKVSLSQEQPCRHHNGSELWCQITFSTIHDELSRPTGFLAILIDISERKQAEAALKDSQNKLHSILGSLKDMVWSVDLETQQFIYLNEAIADFYGQPLANFHQNPGLWLEIIHPEDRAFVEQASERLHTEGIAKDIRYRIIYPNGEIRWLRDRAHLIYDDTGKAIRLDGIATDITIAKQIEADLQSSEERFSRIITTISDGLLVIDGEGMIKFVNPAASKLFGRSQAELLGDHLGIPVITNEITEISLHHPTGALIMAEMRVVDITWGQSNAHLVSLRDITERYTSAQALAQSEEKYRRIVELTTDGIWILDQNQETIFVNQQLAMMLGYSIEELLHHNIFSFMDNNYAFNPLNLSFPTCTLPHSRETQDFKFYRKDQQELWAMVSKSAFFDEEGNYAGELAMVTDITERKAIEQALLESEQRLEGILSSIQDVVWSASAITMETLYLNSATEAVYGRSLTDFYNNPTLWFESIHPEDQVLMEGHLQVLWERGSAEVEYRIVWPSGEIRWLLRRVKVVYDEQGRPLRLDGIDSDITEQKLATEQLNHRATHDSLTGLPNRLLFLDRLGHALQRNSRYHDYHFAVLFLDLDGFKDINNSLGHTYGDLLLQEIAQCLQKCLRPNDTLARLGGDEFTMLLEDIHDVQDAITVANRIHRQLTYPFILNGQEIFTNTSIGIALNYPYYRHPQDILRDADTAMYHAKADGKACYRIFDPAMHTLAVNRLQRENDLRRALERQEFQVYYQPIVDLQEGGLAGLEALIRWYHPSEGLISPIDFIAIAEETGLIIPMGQWILEKACHQVAQLQKLFPQHQKLKISVNISSRQIRDQSLLQKIDQVLCKTQLQPTCLKLEITESILMDNMELATNVLAELRDRNIEICLDDFGTGYSSLSYLHRFPINTLKIDRSFVMPMKPDDENTEIIRTIVMLAHALNLDVIAEGVETEMQVTQLRWLKCEQGQGYYFARPMPYSHLLEWLRDYQSWNGRNVQNQP